MKFFTTISPHQMYKFDTLDGKSYRTMYSPEQILALYSFKAVDEKNDPIHILTKQVNFQTFTISTNKKVNWHFANYLQAWFLFS